MTVGSAGQQDGLPAVLPHFKGQYVLLPVKEYILVIAAAGQKTACVHHKKSSVDHIHLQSFLPLKEGDGITKPVPKDPPA